MVPHLFGLSSFIQRGGEGVRTSPVISDIFEALFLILSFPTISLSALKPQLGCLSLLYPFSAIFESHYGHSLNAPWDLILLVAPRLS